MVNRSQEEAARLRTSLRWLQSHDKRLEIQKRSLQDQLAEVESAIDRLKSEIEQAANRLEELEGV